MDQSRAQTRQPPCTCRVNRMKARYFIHNDSDTVVKVCREVDAVEYRRARAAQDRREKRLERLRPITR